jgi:hypothetical protein
MHTPGDRSPRSPVPEARASPPPVGRLTLLQPRKRLRLGRIRTSCKWHRTSDSPSVQADARHVMGVAQTLALILSCATFWFGLLEGRKVFELRRARQEIPPGGLRVLLVCNKATRRRWHLSRIMAESRCTQRLGPFTAADIIGDPRLRAGVMVADDEIVRYLDGQKGFLYRLEAVKMSKAQWAAWSGNGSNGNNFLPKLDYQGRARWVEK